MQFFKIYFATFSPKYLRKFKLFLVAIFSSLVYNLVSNKKYEKIYILE